MGLPRLPWQDYLDTLPALFLLDPRAPTYSLKPSAERYLNWKPGERDAVVDWLVKNQPVPGVRISDKPKSKNYAGAYIAYAPPSLVGPYACGDTDRTYKLADYAFKQLESRDMTVPYDRERQLLIPLLEMERDGVRVDVRRLRRDIELYHGVQTRLDAWLRKRLKAPGVNLDSDQELAKALIKAHVATRAGLGVTGTGQVQTNKNALEDGVTDKQVLACLRYRSSLGTCMGTFMEPWCTTAEMTASGGRIFTRWHSTRTDHKGGTAGTRTGRLSSTPNFQNMAQLFEALFRDDEHKDLPRAPIALPPLPMIRAYIIPDAPDHVLADRDYSGQELRVTAHYIGGTMLEMYQNDPHVDFHGQLQQRILESTGKAFSRTHVKRCFFEVIYGGGAGKLADMLRCSMATAKELRASIFKVVPELRELYRDMERRAKKHESIRTWGGREYFCEPPVFIDGRMRMFDYKLPNLLIQGSSADITKQAVINYCAAKPASHKLRLTVHDEIVASMPRAEKVKGMRILQDAMESIQLDAKLLTDGKVGRNLSQCK